MSHLSHQHVQHLYATFGELKVLDDIIRHRAADEPPVPILGYPRYEHSVDNYELFTGKQLDQFVDAAVKYFISAGFWPNGQQTVALLAASNVDYIISFFALSRLGYTVLSLSLRITPAAIINLLLKTNCSTIVHGHFPIVESTLRKVKRVAFVNSVSAPIRSDYDRPSSGEPRFFREYNREEENKRIALIIHSSGSTGLPKPVMLSHEALLTHPTQGSGLHNFNALPWYHLYGISTSLQAMWMRKIAYLYNTSLPLTADHLVAVIEAVRPEAVHVVPYALGLMAEKDRGVEALKTCKVVTAAGARTPDELGDRLVRVGINLGIVFGTTEAGLAGDTMRRANGDDSWNYIRLYANIRQYIHMHPLGDNMYEFVYLKGHPALSTSELNDDLLPGSWHSKDVFTPHPSISDVWKYVTRIDDRVTLLNGEKVLPLPIEGRMREDELVREAAVVGVDRSIPGLLVFRADGTDSMSDKAYLDAIWPSVADANFRAEAFSQITREMVMLLPSNINYPQTDKGNIIRAQLYNMFSAQIEELYSRLDDTEEGSQKLDLPTLESYLMTAFRDIVGVSLETLETDFFTAGVDSLMAIQMRQMIQKSLSLNGKRLSANVIYEMANAKKLARYLFALSTGEEVQHEDQSLLMRQLIDKYSEFETHQHLNDFNYDDVLGRRGQAVILTGATGSIGAHTLAQMTANAKTKKIYCLVRGDNPSQRILDSLSERRLKLSGASMAKIIPFAGDLTRKDLGLDASFLAQMKREVSLVIHIAWPVNFNIPLHSFEPHIAGLFNLIQLSLSVKRPEPAQLLFCSSIATAFNTPSPALVPNAPIESFDCVSQTGYARSKFVAEHIVRNAALAGARSYVFRLGQIVGDTQNGIWNDREFVPMVIRSALTLKVLPRLHENCSWLPVDTLATSMLELSDTLAKPLRLNGYDSSHSSVFYNVVNPHVFSWDDLLGELHASGLEFTSVSSADWLQMLKKSAAQDDGVRNPAVKLIEYFEKNYGGIEENSLRGHLTFESTAAQRDSTAMRSAPRVIENGFVRKFLIVWLQRWIAGSYKALNGSLIA